MATDLNVGAYNDSPITLANTLLVTGNGATNINFFTAVGVVELHHISIDIVSKTNNITFNTINFNAFDGANTAQLTAAAGTSMNNFGIGGTGIKTGVVATAVRVTNSNAVGTLEGTSVANDLFIPVILVTNPAGTNYIRLGFVGDADTSLYVRMKIKYKPLSSNGLVVPV